MIDRLAAGTTTDLNRLGGKASGLVRLLDAGLRVPEAWVVPAAVSLDPEAAASLLESALPEWWAEQEATFPDARWAVRSSAVAEDLADASFAGVYQTILGVDSLEALKAAVQTCWSALTDERSQVYRKAKNHQAETGIALVLQRLIRPRVAGVLLTSDPLRPFSDTIVIDASWGLGESVVSGHVEPDHLVLARVSGATVSEYVGSKLTELVSEPGGVVKREVDGVRRAQLCLQPDEIAALHALAIAVDTRIGPRRDLEWAIEGETLYVLQDRPITGLPPLEPTEVWTRRFGDEYLAEYAMPLSKDLLSGWIAEAFLKEMSQLQGRKDLVDMEVLKHHHGYAYFSGSYILEQLSALPPRLRGSSVLEWFTPLWQDQIRAAPWRPQHLLGLARAPFRDKGRGRIGQNLGALETHCTEIDRIVGPWLAQDYGPLSSAELRAQFEETSRLGFEHFRVIRWGMGAYLPMLHTVLERLLASWCDDGSGELYQAIISGIPGTHTAALNHEIHALGLAGRADESLVSGVRSGSSYDELRAAFPTSSFWAMFDAFLAEHGHRGASRDIAFARWHEQPEVVFGLVSAQIRPEVAGPDPAVNEAAAEARRTTAERAAFAAVTGPTARVRTPVLRRVVQLTQQYTVYRENQRYHLDYLITHVRNLVLEQAGRFVRAGVLAAPDDVFLMLSTEFWRLVDAEPSAAELAELRAAIELRRQHYLQHRDRLPATFLFDDVPTEGDEVLGSTAADLGEGAFAGLGASQGIARGVARTVATLSDLAHVEAGDILVASNIDPGWTSVFPMLAGLVTETGGVLSHGAILAREYGIPTVTGVTDALLHLGSGTQVEVDGSAGVVRILDAAVPA